jgi:hypothetical protein
MCQNMRAYHTVANNWIGHDSILSAVSHKLNVSGHMLIWTFYLVPKVCPQLSVIPRVFLILEATSNNPHKKDPEFPDQLNDCQLLKRDCSVELAKNNEWESLREMFPRKDCRWETRDLRFMWGYSRIPAHWATGVLWDDSVTGSASTVIPNLGGSQQLAYKLTSSPVPNIFTSG